MALRLEDLDMTRLAESAFHHVLFLPQPDAVLNIESHVFDVELCAKSMEMKLDIGKQLWLNYTRWNRLIKEYLPLSDWERFKGQAQEILCHQARHGATANMFFHDPKRYAKKHRWGGCLMGAVFRGHPGHPTLTLYSRTSYIGYMGFMDMGLAAVMAREICAELDGVKPSDIRFSWHLSSMQLHCFKSLPYMFSNQDLFNRLERYASGRVGPPPTPTWSNITKWYCKVLEAYEEHGNDMLEHEKYGPFKRIKRRWMEHMGYLSKNVPPSCTLDKLDFSRAIDAPASAEGGIDND